MNRLRRKDISWTLAGLLMVFSVMTVVSRKADGLQPADSQPADEANPDNAFIRKLTKKEISRIRYLELRGMRVAASEQPDRVTVKIPQAVVDEFLVEMQGQEDFKSEAARRDFRKLTPPQKLHIIAKRKGEEYAEKVEVESDPEVFLEFRKQVLPAVFKGCATAGCHAPGNEEQARFSLYKDPKKSPATTYADFVVLNELSVGEWRVIDRAKPGDSLLLTYMLPLKNVKPPMRHPGKEELRPLFQSPNAPGFRRIERWIASLKHPQADYGVRLLPPPTTTGESKEPDEKPASPDSPTPRSP